MAAVSRAQIIGKLRGQSNFLTYSSGVNQKAPALGSVPTDASPPQHGRDNRSTQTESWHESNRGPRRIRRDDGQGRHCISDAFAVHCMEEKWKSYEVSHVSIKRGCGKEETSRQVKSQVELNVITRGAQTHSRIEASSSSS
mmetsp:Transcript_4470/g.8886  ORF Transcript_4470/g.8886 Transcript_4470/m.8886 type:complete len:141 (+) Transcript_4470:414-836(+)